LFVMLFITAWFLQIFQQFAPQGLESLHNLPFSGSPITFSLPQLRTFTPSKRYSRNRPESDIPIKQKPR